MLRKFFFDFFSFGLVQVWYKCGNGLVLVWLTSYHNVNPLKPKKNFFEIMAPPSDGGPNHCCATKNPYKPIFFIML